MARLNDAVGSGRDGACVWKKALHTYIAESTALQDYHIFFYISQILYPSYPESCIVSFRLPLKLYGVVIQTIAHFMQLSEHCRGMGWHDASPALQLRGYVCRHTRPGGVDQRRGCSSTRGYSLPGLLAATKAAAQLDRSCRFDALEAFITELMYLNP